MAIPVTGTFQPSGDFKIADAADLSATANRLFYVDSSGDIQEIILGTDGQVLTSTGASAAPAFEDAAAGGGTDLTTKGDIHGYDTGQARIPIGSNDQVLTADSAQALGLKWATPTGGAGGVGFEDLWTIDGVIGV